MRSFVAIIALCLIACVFAQQQQPQAQEPQATGAKPQEMHQYGTGTGYNSGYNQGYGTTSGYGYGNNRQFDFNAASTTSLSTIAAVFSALCAYALAH